MPLKEDDGRKVQGDQSSDSDREWLSCSFEDFIVQRCVAQAAQGSRHGVAVRLRKPLRVHAHPRFIVNEPRGHQHVVP